jgi:thiol-disulfide isomerase/thioredoxin
MNRTKFLVCLLIAILLPAKIVLGDHYNRLQDEKIIALPDHNNAVLINFWATWCKPCRDEIPALNRLHKKYPQVRFVGINVDDPRNRGAIHGFLKKFPIDYEIFLREGKDFESLAKSFQPEWKAGIPATFVYSEGKQVFSKLGRISEEELDQSLSRLKLTQR